MPKDAFAHVRAWIFDLDNTLYDPKHRLFDQIDQRITDYIARELSVSPDHADTLRSVYWREHGTTLHGLMQTHNIDPAEYLDYVHDIELDHVPASRGLGAAIGALPGRKIVHTNGSRGHAERVLSQLEISGAFDAIYGIEDADYLPKPAQNAYERVWGAAQIDPASAAMFEDTARNLEVPHAMGARTVWRPTEDDHARDGADGAHVHFVADDLAAFLRRLV